MLRNNDIDNTRVKHKHKVGSRNVVQEAINTLNLNIGYQFNKKLSAKIQVKNLTNSDIVMTQELPEANKTVEVERYKEGISFDFGLNYKF